MAFALEASGWQPADSFPGELKDAAKPKKSHDVREAAEITKAWISWGHASVDFECRAVIPFCSTT